MENPSSKEEISRVLKVLEAFRQASRDLQAHPTPKSADSNSPAIKALLELETESDTILCKDPHLSTLSHHLTYLRTLVETLKKSSGHSLRNFLTRRVSTNSISRVAGSIEFEIQAWIDRESIENLTTLLKETVQNEDELVSLLTHFEKRISQGFNQAVEAMLEEGLIKKLVELQRSVLGGDLIDMGRFDEKETNKTETVEGKLERRGSREKRFLDSHPFASCVARFAVQLEVGEGLRQREKRAFKQEILNRVKEASVLMLKLLPL
ncbi:hypothetical protein GH714_014922 [Hevea brasiliensis]|uniref:Uncharacterized protein n=1 Tax=Hevea brasiliensis TaxID=3981 RepID=A0A6A6MDX4_HEVBR|nr:hypothetical protein GH714_014922 [Hevea brasiliensis]